MDIVKEFDRTVAITKELGNYFFTDNTKQRFTTLTDLLQNLQKKWQNKNISDAEATTALTKLQSYLIIIFASSSPEAAKILNDKGNSSSEIIQKIYKELLPVKNKPSFYQGMLPYIGSLIGINPSENSVKPAKPKGTGPNKKNLNPAKNKNSFNIKDVKAVTIFEKLYNPEDDTASIFEKLDNFKEQSPMAGSSTNVPPAKKYKSKAKPPLPPAEGKILYDIPGTMVVNKSQKCIVRIGENEAIVRDNDNFSSGVQIENVKLSNKMQVELIDLSEPPKFRIKTFSAAKQFLEDDGYTEWIFTVTPLENGTVPLYLKVSVIKVINGEEVPREIVFEKSISITSASADSQGLVTNTASNAAQTKQETPGLKDLSQETNVVELPTPKIFISYAHKDKIYFDIFLANFQSQSGWEIWTDHNIEIGSDWFTSIQQSMQQSDCAVLLISSDFISSAFIKEHEFQKFSELKKSKPAFIFMPILLRDCDFTRWKDLSKLQMFSALGSDYNVPSKATQLMPFADMCAFFDNGLLKPNPNIDTYFKNLVMQANRQWIQIQKPA